MTFPSILLGILISSLYGVVFHLFRGGGLGRMILYIILSWIGFWLGNFAGNKFGWVFGSYGPLQILTATLGSVIALALGYWLSLVDENR